jgi:hypothetical protein
MTWPDASPERGLGRLAAILPSMQAIVVRALGDPDVLTLGTHPAPEPGPGEVLVRVRAIGVNFSDTERRRGSMIPPPCPGFRATRPPAWSRRSARR